MPGLSKSNAALSASGQPFVVVDMATLARVAGGLGPHGGWSAPTPAAASSTTKAGGPHGGWVVAPAGPHGGW